MSRAFWCAAMVPRADARCCLFDARGYLIKCIYDISDTGLARFHFIGMCLHQMDAYTASSPPLILYASVEKFDFEFPC